MNVDIVGSRRNRPQLSTRHDDDDAKFMAMLLKPAPNLDSHIFKY